MTRLVKKKRIKLATELTQKREEDYVYEDWHNAAWLLLIAEKRYEAMHFGFESGTSICQDKRADSEVHCLIREFVLGELGRFEEALQVYKQVDERYGKDTDPGVREPVAIVHCLIRELCLGS